MTQVSMNTSTERAVTPHSDSVIQSADMSRALREHIHPIQDPPISSTPVEMSMFDAASASDTVPSQPLASRPLQELPERSGTPPEPNLKDPVSPPTATLSAPESPSNASAGPPESPTSTPVYTPRQKTLPAIGPSTEKPSPAPQESETSSPILLITLLLTNGARHPYKIDDKYLKKRNVSVEDNNPVNMSTYTLKELIWREWREEWEARPSSPGSIRLIYYGKLLDDKMRLHDAKFVIGPTVHVVHMTIKPQDIVDEEDAKIKSSGKDRDGSERTHGCRCVIL